VSDPWAEFADAPKTASKAGKDRRPPAKAKADAFDEFEDAPDHLTATGKVHDGDTFQISSGKNGRLFGVDAFELNQPGYRPTGAYSLGTQSRDALGNLIAPGMEVAPTGGATYGRPVVTAGGDNDVGASMLDEGMAIAVPEYLKNDPVRLHEYMEAERYARLNLHGAHAGKFQTPKDFRDGKPDPWAKPEEGQYGNSIAIFPDDPTPFQGLRPEIEQGYIKVWTDPSSTPEDLLAYAKENGFTIDPETTRKSYIERAKRGAGTKVRYQAPPRVLTDGGGGALGAFGRGIVDPINMADEIGGIGQSLGLHPGRENIWNSDRRFGDILWNNIDQNRSVLDYDEANHPWARTGGQFASALITPGMSIEGVGLAAARQALRTGATRFEAEAIARAAVRRRLATVGGAEGGLAGFGSGEDWKERAENGAMGTILGTLFGYGTGALGQEIAPRLASTLGKGSRAEVAGETASQTGRPAGDEARAALAPYLDELKGIASRDPEVEQDVRATLDQVGPDYPLEQAMQDIRTRHAAQAGEPLPSLGGPAPTEAGSAAARPQPITQEPTDAQMRAASEAIEPRDVFPVKTDGGSDLPDFAGNIRLEGLDTPQDIKRALVQTERRVGFDAATRGRITQQETEQLASDLGMTADQLLARRKGQAFNAEEALAARQILAKSGNELVNMARRIQRLEEPGHEVLGEFRRAWLRHVAIQEQVSGATAEAGRALAQFRVPANSRMVRGDVLAALVNSGGGSQRLKDAADIIVDAADDPALLNRIAEKAAKPRFRDKLVELWYNSLLSGPQTHAVNVLSNTLTSLAQLPEHALAAGLGKGRQAFVRNEADRVSFSEVGARAAGLIQGTKEGLAQFAKTVRTGEPSDFVSKVEAQSMKAISGKKGELVRIPTRMLSAEDELFKAMARRMELSGLAVRAARKEGLKGDTARARASELLANPSDEMLEKAFDYGRYVTFQRPLGAVGSKISAITQDMPLFKLVLPFVRTPTNLLKFAVERSPAAPLLKEWRKDFGAGGARRDLAIARSLAGTGLGLVVAQMAADGHITGSGPADDGAKALLRADGWQPYSIRIGDKYYSYQRLDPFSTTLGVAADLAAKSEYMTDSQRDKVTGLLTASIMQSLASKTWLSGVSDLVEAVNEPERFGPNYIEKLAGSIAVPGAVAQVARTVDPTLRDAQDILDAVKARTPGLSKSVVPRRDAWGQPMTSEGGVGPNIVSPIWTSTRKNDPGNNALLAAGIHVGQPDKTIAGAKLSPQQYGEYREASGHLAHESVNALVTSKTWDKMTPDEKEDEVRKILRDSRKQVRNALLTPSTQAAPANDAWSEFKDAR
jgi:endonuclease YncB( thermonuclease family)